MACKQKKRMQIVVGTDPDCDRLGIGFEIIMENDIIERKSNYGFDDCILRTTEKKR
jgi:phosphomannomutase